METIKEKIQLVKKLINQAIKENKSITLLCVENNLSRSFVSDFLRRIPKEISTNDKKELKELYRKYRKTDYNGVKTLSDTDKEKIGEIYYDKSISWDERMDKICKLSGKSERSVRKWLVKLGFKHKIDKLPEQLVKAKEKELEKGKKRFLVTAAQNATPINPRFLKNLEAYAKYIGAQILCIPFRYQNPTSIYTEHQKENEWWDEKIGEYLCFNRYELNNSITVLADLRINPTASNPLSSLESITGDHSTVIGHPRVHLKSLPVLEGSKSKVLMTTGSITKSNHTQTKAGTLADFHHVLGCCVIELKDDNTFFARQITSTNGDFTDLFNKVVDGVVSKVDSVEALIMGDIHVSEVDKDIVDVTFNDLCKKLYHKKLFLHDIMDSGSVSYHNLNDPFILHKKEMDGTNSLEKEMNEMLDWLEQVKQYNVFVVRSNHCEHIEKFLSGTDWRRMPTFKNAIPYMEYSMAKLKGEAPYGIVPYVINKRFPKIKCLGLNDSHKVKGWELAQHGHIGTSGSRGSIMQYRKLNSRMVVGHSHQPVRLDGALSVGCTTKLRLSYNNGPSAWQHCHIIINEFGKAQHIIFIKDKNGKPEYTTLK